MGASSCRNDLQLVDNGPPARGNPEVEALKLQAAASFGELRPCCATQQCTQGLEELLLGCLSQKLKEAATARRPLSCAQLVGCQGLLLFAPSVTRSSDVVGQQFAERTQKEPDCHQMRHGVLLQPC